ncbi:MAG: dipeptidase [Clostridia bacterium]|nr:dipeptidase [Clostridia bacterium]
MKIPVGDAHCDFLYYMANKRWDIGAKKDRQTIYLPSLREGGVKLQFFAVWMDADQKQPFVRQCSAMLDAFDTMLDKHPDALVPFSKDYTPADERIACVLTIEGGEAIEGEIDALDRLYARGVRAMTLTWNYRNDLAYPATGLRNRGLTRLGKAAVERMSSLGIALDVAHLNDAGIDDVLERASRPIFASHSNARAVYESKRSLCDRHIQEIAKGGGVICVNFYPRQLSKGEATAEDVVRHIDHIAGLVGTAHVGIGSDFDGMNCMPKDLRSSADIPILWEKLLRLGYSQADVERIAYHNLRDYIVQFY